MSGAELSLGDILGSFIASVLELPQFTDLDAQYHSALWLARHFAQMTGVSSDEAYNCLTYVPDNMLTLLHSPQGWTALASYIAADRGLPEPAYYPTIQ